MAQTFDQFLKEAKIGSQWFVHDDTDLEAYKRVVQIDKEPKMILKILESLYEA